MEKWRSIWMDEKGYVFKHRQSVVDDGRFRLLPGSCGICLPDLIPENVWALFDGQGFKN